MVCFFLHTEVFIVKLFFEFKRYTFYMPSYEKNIAISRTPYRIGLGGATDLIPYVKEFGGHAFSAALDKYVTIIVRARPDRKITFHYAHGREEEGQCEDIKHPYVRAALLHVGISRGADIVSLTDVPFSSGLGSSGAFTVGLLNALWSFAGIKKSPRDLAEEAAHLELNVLKSPIGKHDQYLAAFGGMCALKFLPEGTVQVKKISLPRRKLNNFEERLLLVHSGTTRKASRALSPVHKSLVRRDPETIRGMHEFRAVGTAMADNIRNARFGTYGASMNTLWKIQKKVFGGTNSHIDLMLDYGKKHGAVSGMVAGAGGGGFLLFVCRNHKDRLRLMKIFLSRGFEVFPFKVAEAGSRIIFSK